ncbi:hypothetical protein ACHAXA_006966 [Cyclostephanos tholiformis]|uniref:Uncharacterized protein n=1 Tax=Cyclostephanos tholiformis TaxID=382380 RepID=A0ABD3RXD9_9STRA
MTLHDMLSPNVLTLAAMLAIASVDAQNLYIRNLRPRKLRRVVTHVDKADYRQGLEEDVAFWTKLVRKTQEMSLPPDVVPVPTNPPVSIGSNPPIGTAPPGTTPPIGTSPPVVVDPTAPPAGGSDPPIGIFPIMPTSLPVGSPTLPPVPGDMPTLPPVPAVMPTYPPTLPPIGGSITEPPASGGLRWLHGPRPGRSSGRMSGSRRALS